MKPPFQGGSNEPISNNFHFLTVETTTENHRKDKERVEKDAHILSRYHNPNKEEGEVKAEPSIATATSAPPKEEKASNSATLSPSVR